MATFKATPDQLKQLVANAVNASIPMGMGYLHYKKVDYSPEQFDVGADKDIAVDYLEGRMVKLYITSLGLDMYEIGDKISIDYQSWMAMYPTVQDLIVSSGAVNLVS